VVAGNDHGGYGAPERTRQLAVERDKRLHGTRRCTARRVEHVTGDDEQVDAVARLDHLAPQGLDQRGQDVGLLVFAGEKVQIRQLRDDRHARARRYQRRYPSSRLLSKTARSVSRRLMALGRERCPGEQRQRRFTSLFRRWT
jgi:hypothetical protein